MPPPYFFVILLYYSIPSAFADSGVIFGTFLLLVGGWATIFSIELLVDSRKYTGLISLEEISVVCFGKKFGFFVEVMHM
jgi:amino acid permease